MAYQLIAVDMDGTLLNSKKEITPRTEAAVTAALARGYHVVMTTGRGYRQIVPYMAQFPAMRYAITSSGAAVADYAQDRIISAQNLPDGAAAELVRAFEGLDGFPIIFSNGEALYRPELLDDPQVIDEPAAGLLAYIGEVTVNGKRAALSRCALSGGEAGLLLCRFRRARQVPRARAGCARLGRSVRERGRGGQRHRRR